MSEDYSKYINQVVTTEKNSKYTITKYISEGGNGFVFECINDKNEIYVLKLLHTTNSVKIENFKKEIELEKNLKSKHIVKCIDNGEQKFGHQKKTRPFYIMKKYAYTLEDLINKNKITPLNAYKYSIQLCKAIKILHKYKEPIIHRDLKPENILYDEKNNMLLLGDFGLAHLNTNNKTINQGFVGNIDYHAPEQKKRGKSKVGTYTDIYSLGLIINVLFTKEIAQGENYKKIWQVAPYFSFLDDIVDKMIRHDITMRENDISSILIELEKNDMKYETKESLLKSMYGKNLPNNEVDDLINLYSLFNYSIKNKMNWNEINLNYYCDYHFSCNKILLNSILLNCYYNKIKNKFEYEGNIYKDNIIPYDSLDLSFNDNRIIYESFVSKINNLSVLPEIESIKNIIKKYFLSLCDYHAKEIIDELEIIEKTVKKYCLDAPILCISYYINNDLSVFCDLNYDKTNLIIFDRYESSDNIYKRQFLYDIDEDFKELVAKIKLNINEMNYFINNNKLEICFDNFEYEKLFKNLLLKIANNCKELKAQQADILDIVNQENYVGLNKIYIIDKHNASILNNYL